MSNMKKIQEELDKLMKSGGDVGPLLDALGIPSGSATTMPVDEDPKELTDEQHKPKKLEQPDDGDDDDDEHIESNIEDEWDD